MITTKNVKTKLDKKGVAVTTALAMDWTKALKQATSLIPLAQESAVITMQARWRRAKQIPKVLKVDMADFIASLGQGQPVQPTVEGLANAASGMSKEERAKLIAQLQEADKAQKAA